MLALILERVYRWAPDWRGALGARPHRQYPRSAVLPHGPYVVPYVAEAVTA